MRCGGSMRRKRIRFVYRWPFGASMSKRHTPPTRMSISLVSILNPAGPNQFGKCSGSVQAAKTTSRLALMTRERTISRSISQRARAASGVEVMAISCAFEDAVWLGASVAPPSSWWLLLERRYIGFEPVEAGFPDGALLGEPVLGPLHGAWHQAACADAAVLLRLDEAAGFQHTYVLHQARQSHVERLSELAHGSLALREPRNDCAPRWIGERAEHVVEMRRIVSHTANNRCATGICQQ